jgi:hypothetical protein
VGIAALLPTFSKQGMLSIRANREARNAKPQSGSIGPAPHPISFQIQQRIKEHAWLADFRETRASLAVNAGEPDTNGDRRGTDASPVPAAGVFVPPLYRGGRSKRCAVRSRDS